MEKSIITNSSRLNQSIISTAIIFSLFAILITFIGAVRWFHFPYFFFLDEWHFLWLMVALSCGLILSLFILDPLIIQNLSQLLIPTSRDTFATELKTVLISTILGILGMIILESIMILWGISSALRGLVNLGVGVSWLWSSRFYWIAVFAERLKQ
ncbi:MAG: hypothetical protein WBA77_19675 [Microcoleaceae cyanobacterium]